MLSLVASLGLGAEPRPGCPVIGRTAHGGGFQPGGPRGAELRELALLSLLGAASLAPSSAGGLRFPIAAPSAGGEGTSWPEAQWPARHSVRLGPRRAPGRVGIIPAELGL